MNPYDQAFWRALRNVTLGFGWWMVLVPLGCTGAETEDAVTGKGLIGVDVKLYEWPPSKMS